MRGQPGDYHEVLRPPPRWWALALSLVVAVWWCFLVATPLVVACVAGVAATGVVGVLLVRYGAVRVVADADGLRAGAAVLPWRHVGTVEVLDAAQTRTLLGVGADARAYLVVRPYCPEAVRVEVDDPRDPTPYWVISTRHADELALHLRPRSMQD